jgi:restriction system protein
MARRSSVIEDLMELSSRIPWTFSLGLALTLYLALHLVAQRYSVQPVASEWAGVVSLSKRQLVVTLATILQIVLPLAFLTGAVVSVTRRAQAGALFKSAKRTASNVAQMSWVQFEQLVGEAFRRQGYSAVDNVVAGPDGGVDLVLTRGGERFLVQCKHWRTRPTGVSVVRELLGVAAARGASGVFVVTSGRFTAEAEAFAATCRAELIDGRRLEVMIGADVKLAGHCAIDDGLRADQRSVISSATPDPVCPRCGGLMALRTARRGAMEGRDFWGCRRFPRCSGTLRA